MRAYNFPVHTAPDDGSDRVFRLVLDPRFSAAEMLADYPRNVVQPFLDIVIAEGKQPSLFKAAGPHAIDVSMPAPHRVSDADRAILTNLMDFGQDFDSARSTTISELVFTMAHPDEHVAGRFLEALARRNAEAVAFMNDIMQRFPPEDDYSTRSWPDDLIERYSFGILLDYENSLDDHGLDLALRLLNCLHDVNMWNGFNTLADPQKAMMAGGSGISVEIGAENGAINYLVERPVCDPALSILILVEKIERLTGARPRSWKIHVEAAD
jgi:hypothetical protein